MSQTGIVLILALIASHQQQHNQQVRAEKAEVHCMTQALYYEARGEGQQGQEAVAEVILQRVRSRAHPDTICGVVHEPYQFSFVMDGSTLRPVEAEAWENAAKLATRIVRGELVTSLTRRAQFYHQVDIRPAWADEMVATARIGNHIFYRLPPRARAENAATQIRVSAPSANRPAAPRDA